MEVHGSLNASLTLFMLSNMDPSVTVGGASKEVGPSSSVSGEAMTGLVGVTVHEEVTTVSGAEPGEVGVRVGGSSLKPGLFGEGIGLVPGRTREAYRKKERERLMSQ